DGRIFYAMKLVRGHRLDERPLARTEALRLFLRLCEAVAFAHANGVVHFDLKPANVMVGAFGEVLVMDWGVARAIGESSPQFAIGTRGYMAPEQERGEAVDARTDVFALGAILRELVCDAPKPLRALIEKCAAPNAHDRFENAAQLAAEVARFLDGEPLL